MEEREKEQQELWEINQLWRTGKEIFRDDVRTQIEKEYPNLGLLEVNKIIDNMWNQLDEKEKAIIESRADENQRKAEKKAYAAFEEIEIESYQDKLVYIELDEHRFGVRGDRNKYQDVLKLYGGIWNPNLPGGPGWTFPIGAKRDVKEVIDAVDEQIHDNILPIGWIPHVSKTTGNTYYENMNTGEIQWDFPTQELEELPLPKGWKKYTSSSRNHFRPFYKNLVTGETQWIRPTQEPEKPKEPSSDTTSLPSTAELLKQKSKDELLKLCEQRRVDCKKSWDKTKIAQAIRAAKRAEEEEKAAKIAAAEKATRKAERKKNLAFGKFVRAYEAEVKEENPDLTTPEIKEKLNDMWMNLTDFGRAEWMAGVANPTPILYTYAGVPLPEGWEGYLDKDNIPVYKNTHLGTTQKRRPTHRAGPGAAPGATYMPTPLYRQKPAKGSTAAELLLGRTPGW